MRHEVACRSCPYFNRKGPSMSLDEPTVLNQVRTGQRNEAPRGAGYQSREAYPSGSHTPDECQVVDMANTCESAIKVVTRNKRKWLLRLNQKVMEVGLAFSGYAVVTHMLPGP